MPVLAWQRRPEALRAAGMVTTGEATRALLAQLKLASEEAMARLSLVATRDLLVVLGAADDLPWVDGARYCAPDPAVQTLWLPTTVAPLLPPDLLRRSAGARVGERAVLLWNDPEQFLPLHQPRNLTPALLAWVAEECG
jgi:hypothetical protein